MKLQTTIAIDVHDGQLTKNTKVTCEIQYVVSLPNGDKRVKYKYLDDNGDSISVKNDIFEAKAADIQPLFDAVSSTLTDINADYNAHEWDFYKEAAKMEMLSSFSGLTDTTQIVEI